MTDPEIPDPDETPEDFALRILDWIEMIHELEQAKRDHRYVTEWEEA